jgi:hypothetical protein
VFSPIPRPSKRAMPGVQREMSAMPSKTVIADTREVSTERAAEPSPAEVRASRQAKRVPRLKVHVGAWVAGATLITSLWVLNQWRAHGAFQHFGSHSGNAGDWNPTLWASAVGLWGLVVGLMALRMRMQRPPSETEIARELVRLRPLGEGESGELAERARARLEHVRRLGFHVAAWAWGMVVLAPLWALLEWQDNGGLRRWSAGGRPGDWEPWILYVGGIWALAVLLLGLRSRSGPTSFSRRTGGWTSRR